MKEDCRNDCVETLRFPKTLTNRPGLSHFDYRIGTYADIRDALLRNLDKTPGLSQWTHRGADDPGIALLEGASILGDILTFYQELYANEAYLRTAQWRESISDLVRLLGYRLSPGLGGNALFAFEVKGDQPVVIPPAFPLKAEVEGSPAPVDFETVAQTNSNQPTLAYPWLSKFNLYRPLETPDISSATNEFYVQAPDQLTAAEPVVLKAGDRLLLGEKDAGPNRLNNAEIAIVDSIRVLHGIKVFKIKGKLQRSVPVPQLAAYKLGRSFHHFGHNGPNILIKPPDPVKSTATVNADKTTTVVSDPPMEINLSFFRSISGNTASDNIAVDISTSSASTKSGATARLDLIDQMGALVEGASLDTAEIGDFEGRSIIDWRGKTARTFFIDTPPPKIKDSQAPLLIAKPILKKTEFPLDAEVQDLASGVTLIIQGPLYQNNNGNTASEFAMMRDINSIKTTSVTWGLSTGTVSMLTLNQSLEGSSGGNNFMDIREVLFHETLSPLLTLRAAMRETAPASGKTLNFYGPLVQAQNLMGRTLFFVEATGESDMVTVTAVDPLSVDDGLFPLLQKITVDRDLNYADYPNEAPYKVTVYGNVVEATQGKTEKLAPLGNGDSRLVFQTFKLSKSPLTYLRSGSATPPEVPELQIYVNNRLWKRVASFFGRKPDEEIYIVREDPDNISWVQFGDGKTGARVPSGIKNVAAIYRTGTGAFGALKVKTKVQASAKLDGLDKIQMPVPAWEGAQSEDGENARAAAPGKIQSLDRLVSLEDFESEALGMPGITKAAATWELIEDIPQVTLTVLMETGRNQSLTQLQETVDQANSGRGPNRFPIKLNLGQLNYVAIKATFGYDSTYLEEEIKKEIQKALGVSSGELNVVDDQSGLFSLRRRSFGQKEYATTIVGVMQQVAGVVWVEVTGFDSFALPLPQDLINSGVDVRNLRTVDCDTDRVLTLQKGHLYLVGQTVTLREVST